MVTVTQAAKLVGVSAGTIRLWEEQGLVAPQRTTGGHRTYDEHDMERLRKIAWWRRVRGLNAAAIRRILDDQDYASLSSPTTPVAAEPPLPLRSFRKRAGLTLKDVSERSGLSISFLSAVERGVSGLSPTARARVLGAIEGDVEVTSQGDGGVHRLGSGKRVDIAPGITYEWLSGHTGLMEPQLAVLQPGARSENTYQHDGEEFILVLSGEFEIALNGRQEILRPRDSIHFDSQTPHSWANHGGGEAEILWVTTERGVWTAGVGSHRQHGSRKPSE